MNKKVGLELFRIGMNLILLYIPFKGKERRAYINCRPAKLHAALVNFGFFDFF